MPHSFTIIFGKAIRRIARLRGGGSALPGLFVEKVSPDFIPRTLSTLPKGVVLVTGTNGKTTTTKMITEMLEGQGLRVFTNRTGSNFTRGVAAALLGEIDTKGNLSADIAVLELDEAYAVKFADIIAPRYSLLLNVMRDQLDRFGEIDATAKLLQSVAEKTTEKAIINREDNRLRHIGSTIKPEAIYYGLGEKVREHFPNDDELHGAASAPVNLPQADVLLLSTQDNTHTFKIAGVPYDTSLKVNGAYNISNAAGALALARAIIPDAPVESLLSTLKNVTPAFGRGEILEIGGHPLELILVKNPSGFRLSLESFSPENYATMIAINDDYADGRDMSWLWDVNFSSLPRVATISGIRAYDMALRLQYEEVPVGSVNTNLDAALRAFIQENAHTPKRIYCTYTAMLSLRKTLSKITKVEVIS